jgi:hypothetical protein
VSSAPPPADQVHIDLGALAQRVTGTERAIDDVNGRLDGLGTQLNGLATSFGDQMRFLGDKIDKRLETKPTNWIGFATASAAIVSVMLAIGGAVMVPVFGDLRELGESIKSVQDKAATEKELEQAVRAATQRADKQSQLIEELGHDKISLREHDEFRANVEGQLAALEKTGNNRFIDFDKSIGDRLTAILSRLDALSARINETVDHKTN